ncbi:MAG: CPBP family glutamic-type intramembrane protease [Pigmentiphaga sp.]|nr:CPBP family glutamic-type intramembrane protease [Pigmentiphaga sp.]
MNEPARHTEGRALSHQKEVAPEREDDPALRPASRHRPLEGWRMELADFWRFVRRPRLAPRLPHRAMPALATDWMTGLAFGRILRWVLLLWLVNFLVFGPLAAGIAHRSGAEHRFDPVVLPWMLALVWAPVIEELMFRLGMRRPGAALWLLPAFGALAWFGRSFAAGAFLAVLLAAVACPRPGSRATAGGWQPLLPGVRWSWRWNRRYVACFPWVFHGLTAGFAWLHLFNFALGSVPWWTWIFLILPQWFTGLALGWLRVRGGMALAMLVHAGFNAGPMLLLWMFNRMGALG